MSRLRAGEWAAVAGAAGLLVALFLPWFRFELPVPDGSSGVLNIVRIVGDPDSSGWDSLGWFVLVLALVAIGSAAWLAIANATARPVAQLVAASVLAALAGTLAFVALALRALIFQPGPNEFFVLRYGAWLGLLAALVLAIGGWWAIKDDRTDAPESAYTPPESRPPPPARAA